ncbi:MAG: toxin-antitoxin system HicB family antitoxin [Planctomycetales bacterium]|nr:toxin-antitoxin system HicB family antitoxin [Planctomycetales bacterium]
MITCEKKAEVKRVSEDLLAQGPDWVTFYREILGLHGVVRHTFPTREAFAAFEQSEDNKDILQMLAKLRRQGPAALDENEPTRVITVRLPKSLHEALRAEAHDHRTSMNKLCISKLLQFIDGESVPADTEPS